MTKESNRYPCFYPSLTRWHQTHSSYPTTKTGWLTMKGKQLKELPRKGQRLQLTCFKSILLVPSWRAWGQGTLNTSCNPDGLKAKQLARRIDERRREARRVLARIRVLIDIIFPQHNWLASGDCRQRERVRESGLGLNTRFCSIG